MTDFSNGKHPIRVVAQRTGLKADLIRAWERRYGAIKPQRSEGRHRFYSDQDIERLILLREATSSARSIGQLAGLSDDALRRLIEEDRQAAAPAVAASPPQPVERAPQGPRRSVERVTPKPDLLTAALDGVVRLDGPAVSQALDQGAMQLGFSRALGELVEPLLSSAEVMRGEHRLRAMHDGFVRAAVRAFLQTMVRRTPDVDGPRAVAATPTGYLDETGILLMAAHAVAEGWHCSYLGPSVAGEEIAAALRTCASTVVLTDLSSGLPSAQTLGELRRWCGLIGPGASVLVGALVDQRPWTVGELAARRGGEPAAALVTVRDTTQLRKSLARLRTRRPAWQGAQLSRSAVGLRELPVSFQARQDFQLDASWLGESGGLRIGSLRSARRVVHHLNGVRPDLTIYAGELKAAALLHEIAGRSSLAQHGPARETGSFDSLWSTVESEVPAATDLLRQFRARFPVDRLGSSALGSEPAPGELLRRLLLVRLLNLNPACRGVRRLFDDGLDGSEVYAAVERVVRRAVRDRDGQPSWIGQIESAVEAHRESLEGQLQYWLESAPGLPEDLADRLWLCLDVLHEERAPSWEQRRAAAPAEAPSSSWTLEELPRPPKDRRAAPWARGVVLQAKNVQVWLHQLSRRFDRPVRTLDQIPTEALEELARFGINALWLIGIWRRGAASAKIKHATGRPDAVSSAYAVDAYEIDPSLGGSGAKRDLESRARELGIRLACDIMPNHTAIDGRWVIETPERFMQVAERPYPSYTYSGPDLSDDPRVSIFLEDHYADQSDAAVVFQRVDRRSGEVRFLYHGNDGSSLPWNDTAQLDYSREDVRRALVDQVVRLAAEFPILRLNGARMLIREHFQRLWFPEPGKGGAVPSRAEHQMSRESFRRSMPEEVWVEVLDALAERAPETLLVAEGFWNADHDFVQRLGMDRVYDTTLMAHLREDRPGELVADLKRVLETDPLRLDRLVHSLAHPDESPAAEIFGTGDRYIAVCTLLVTLPGLPMWGHGQWEGSRETYSMDTGVPERREDPDAALAIRHEREILPLLAERRLYANAATLRLFETVEPVVAFVNGEGDERRLVVVHLGSRSVVARLHHSVPYRTEGGLRIEPLADALDLSAGPTRWVDGRHERAFLLDAATVREQGWSVDLQPWQALVLRPVAS